MYTNFPQDFLKNKKKLAFVTGAAQGIGAEIVRCFAGKGYFVAFADNNKELGLEREKELEGKGKFYLCDLSKQEQVKALCESIKKDFEKIDAIVHSARFPAKEKDLEKNIESEWDKSFQVMLKHPVFLNHLLLELLKKSDNPSILYIGSTNSNFISQQPLSYHIVKGALLQTVRYLAVEYAPYKIRVNLLNPGIADVPGRNRRNPELFQRIIESVIPLKRAVQAREVGDCCLFFASDEAKYFTGSSIDLDGGEHLKDHFHLMMSHVMNETNRAGVLK